jgi:hypothetical protein
MDEYVKKIPEISKVTVEFNGKILTDPIKKEIGSLLGQISWAGRQGRPDLMYGVSHCQQLAGLGDPEAIVWLKRLLQRARQSMEVKIGQLGCGLDEVIVVSASDAAFAAQPRHGSQGGVTCLIGHPQILQQNPLHPPCCAVGRLMWHLAAVRAVVAGDAVGWPWKLGARSAQSLGINVAAQTQNIQCLGLHQCQALINQQFLGPGLVLASM